MLFQHCYSLLHSDIYCFTLNRFALKRQNKRRWAYKNEILIAKTMPMFRRRYQVNEGDSSHLITVNKHSTTKGNYFIYTRNKEKLHSRYSFVVCNFM